jgi:hypothetical protein
MIGPIDEATARFLETAATDLQRQLGIAGNVVHIQVMEGGRGLVATIAFGRYQFGVTANGENIVEAYAEMRRQMAAGVLATTYRQVIEHLG